MQRKRFLLALLFSLMTSVTHAKESELEQKLVEGIPRRPANAMTGSQFIRYTANMPPAKREQAILREFLRGNVPDYMRHLKPVTMRQFVRGRSFSGTIWVMPDYAAIGSNEDHVRIPMNLYTATKIADALGFTLPTRKMVNAIYQQAVRLNPLPLDPGRKMTSNDYYLNHNKRIEEQIKTKPKGALLAGHKKDIVISNRLLSKPWAIAIYGWHKLNGNPIQPLSTVHSADYADYSHGVRFVSKSMNMNGELRAVYDVLEDRNLWQMLSDEGALTQIKTLIKKYVG